jgi:hypothetical protein
LPEKLEEMAAFIMLETDQALFGYGSEDSGWSTSKQGKARAETLTPGTAIACVPVLDQKDICNRLVDGKERKMFYWWTVVQNYMDEDANEDLYDTSSHNCCTVASNAIKEVGGHLEGLDFTSFNEGYGTIDTDGMTLLKFIGLSASISSEVSRASSNKVTRFLFKNDGIMGTEVCHDYSQGVAKEEVLVDNAEEKNKEKEGECSSNCARV